MATYEHLWLSSPGTNLLDDDSPNLSSDSDIFSGIEVPDFQNQSIKEINLLDYNSPPPSCLPFENQDWFVCDLGSLDPNTFEAPFEESKNSANMQNQTSSQADYFHGLETKVAFLTQENKRLEDLLGDANSTISSLKNHIENLNLAKFDDALKAKCDDIKENEEKNRAFKLEIEALKKENLERAQDYEKEKSLALEKFNQQLLDLRNKVGLYETKLLESKLEKDSLRNILEAREKEIERLEKMGKVMNDSRLENELKFESSLVYINYELEKGLLMEQKDTCQKHLSKLNAKKQAMRDKIKKLKKIIMEKDHEIDAQKFVIERLQEEIAEMKPETEEVEYHELPSEIISE